MSKQVWFISMESYFYFIESESELMKLCDFIQLNITFCFLEDCPRKKPFTIEEQFARDKQGRRRFHGAFTGGFSAGFLNTVGSLEGWRPSSFKSSKSEKGTAIQQRPEQFMDEEVTYFI